MLPVNSPDVFGSKRPALGGPEGDGPLVALRLGENISPNKLTSRVKPHQKEPARYSTPDFAVVSVPARRNRPVIRRPICLYRLAHKVLLGAALLVMTLCQFMDSMDFTLVVSHASTETGEPPLSSNDTRASYSLPGPTEPPLWSDAANTELEELVCGDNIMVCGVARGAHDGTRAGAERRPASGEVRAA